MADQLLRMRGDHLAPDIQAGDVLQVCEQNHAEDGALAVVCGVDDVATVRRCGPGDEVIGVVAWVYRMLGLPLRRCPAVMTEIWRTEMDPMGNIYESEVDRLTAERDRLRAILDGCDDAAIERGAQALAATDSDYRYVSETDIRAAVLSVLRAAGERSVETDEIHDTPEEGR